MPRHEKINYLELPSTDLEKTKTFFQTVFEWQFTDFGSEYSAFNHAGIDGGFFLSDQQATTEKGSVLVVFYSLDLTLTASKIEHNGGRIIKPIFNFPGGQRFHFCDPTGNEFAVWSDQNLNP